MAKLKPEEKEMLDTVMRVAGSNPNRIRNGVAKALQAEKDMDPARGVYLRNLLYSKARAKIRRNAA